MNEHGHHHITVQEKLLFAVILTALVFFVELFGGFWTRSLALLSDAIHVFMDLFALLLSYLAIYLASRPISERRSYGWHRAEVFVAFFNGLTVFIIALGIIFSAIQRLLVPQPIKAGPMFVIAVLGLAVNLLVMKILAQHSHKDLNLRSAFLHVVGDTCSSAGVVIGGIVMYFTGNYLADPIVGMLIGLVISAASFRLLKEAGEILLEGVPRGVDPNKVMEEIAKVPGVVKVNDLHIWCICTHLCTLSAHVLIETEQLAQQKRILQQLEKMLKEKFGVAHSTIQIETRDKEDGHEA
ncbi:MAG: cation diffusion facilitator family transporter [Elusimicrobiota bacterium]